MTKLIVTLTGPSCSGKTTIQEELVNQGFAKIVSHTTRKMRAGEKNGVDYHFVSEEEFLKMEKEGGFLETVEFSSAHYGASKAEFEKAFATGKPVVIIVEPNGMFQIQEACPELGWTLLTVFIDVSPAVASQRFLSRFQADMAHAFGVKASNTEVQAVMNSYQKRLAAMLDYEFYWRVQSRHTGMYDLVETSLDQAGKEKALNRIFTAVNKSVSGE